MDEKWVIIGDFPMYRVSNYGQVLNHATGKLINSSQTKGGLVKIGLVQGGIQYTRGLAVIVADAFVFGRTDIFNTPIHLDGDQTNNRAENLMWRPRWFAWKYFHQFDDPTYQKRGPVLDVVSKVWYPTILDAATQNGLLFKDIMRSIAKHEEVFPTRQIFSFRE